MTNAQTSPERIQLTADIVSAYVLHNSVSQNDIATLISLVHQSLAETEEPAAPKRQALVPPVSVNKSITPDYLISLENGRRYKTLRRHLGGRGLTPEQYRAKWALPWNYPMVAPSYAKRRSELAKAAGLGTSLFKTRETAEAAASATKVRRGRRPKATADAV